MEPAPERNTLIITAVPQWTRLVGGARAVGEVDVARAALRRMETTAAPASRWPERPLHAGVQTLGIHLLTRWGRRSAHGALALRGYVAPAGPVLADGPWDDVLVTKARCDDGSTLALGLRPRRQSTRHGDSAVRRARPRQAYRLDVSGHELTLTADADGRATAAITLDGPTRASLARHDGTTTSTAATPMADAVPVPIPDEPVKEAP